MKIGASPEPVSSFGDSPESTVASPKGSARVSAWFLCTYFSHEPHVVSMLLYCRVPSESSEKEYWKQN